MNYSEKSPEWQKSAEWRINTAWKGSEQIGIQAFINLQNEASSAIYLCRRLSELLLLAHPIPYDRLECVPDCITCEILGAARKYLEGTDR